jgi:hypothetical protein
LRRRLMSVFRLVSRMRFSAEKVFAILVQLSGYRIRGMKLNARQPRRPYQVIGRVR